MWLLDWVVTFDKQSDHNLYIYIYVCIRGAVKFIT